MGASLRVKTMHRISDAQEPAYIDQETSEEQEIKIAMLLIKSGDRDLIRKAVCKLIPVCFGFELSQSELLLLAARKQIYTQQVAEEAARTR